jgi:RND family efflux transporter MFP subunit
LTITLKKKILNSIQRVEYAMKLSRTISLILLIVVATAIAWKVYDRLGSLTEKTRPGDKDRSTPVEIAPIETAFISFERVFSGTLEAHAEFVAAPKIGGKIEHLFVKLGDTVKRGQVIAKLDNAELMQSVAQAEADLEVAKANREEADSQLKIAERELKRIDKLSATGVSSASQRDIAEVDQLAKKAYVQVTQAQMLRAQAQLETTRIQLGYSEVKADWQDDDSNRIVAERFVNEGETVTANTPLLRIVKLDPMTAVIYVTEREYAGLQIGQKVSLTTDAYPDSSFHGAIERIAPVFRESTRQARVEVQVDNAEQKLKPGMFVRARVVLASLEEATVIPFKALTSRDGEDGVFILSDDSKNVRWNPAQAGIRQEERLQISGENLSGYVVTLGQQLLKDGSSVILSEDKMSR